MEAARKRKEEKQRRKERKQKKQNEVFRQLRSEHILKQIKPKQVESENEALKLKVLSLENEQKENALQLQVFVRFGFEQQMNANEALTQFAMDRVESKELRISELQVF